MRSYSLAIARRQHIVDSEPGFAERLRGFLDADVHQTIATLRADGSPRISERMER